MSSETELEMWKAHRAAQEKFTYFMLAASGACIGFALTQTKDLRLNCDMAWLGAALLAWAGSFYLGCKYAEAGREILLVNKGLLVLNAGRDPYAGTDVNRVSIGNEVFQKRLDDLQKDAAGLYRWEFRLLILGVVFYVIWQVLLMSSR